MTSAHEVGQGSCALYDSWIAQHRARQERIRPLWDMTPEERVEAMYRGQLTFGQLCAWAAARPEEVPLLDGEFWFIAIRSADTVDRQRRPSRDTAPRRSHRRRSGTVRRHCKPQRQADRRGQPRRTIAARAS